MKRIIVVFSFLLVLSTSIGTEVYAQCAMCRASVENSISEGENTIGAGLNSGILYLGAMPYLIFIVIAFAWYRHSKKETSKKLRIANILRTKLR